MRLTSDLSELLRADSITYTADSGTIRADLGATVTSDSTLITADWQSLAFSSYSIGYWASPYWNSQYYDKRYWAEIQVTVSLKPSKVGGDDVPRYYRKKHRGWNKKLWKKHRLIDGLIDQTLNDILFPKPKKNKQSKYVPDYELILRQLREIDDAEAEMLLL